MKSMRSLANALSFPRRKRNPVGEMTIGSNATADNGNVQSSFQPQEPPMVTVEEADDESVNDDPAREDPKTQYDITEATLPDTAPLPPEQSTVPPDSFCFTEASLLDYQRRVDGAWKGLMSQRLKPHPPATRSPATRSPATYIPGQQNLPLSFMNGVSDDPMKGLDQFMTENKRAGDNDTRDTRGFNTSTGHNYTSWVRSPRNTATRPGQQAKDELHPAYRPFLRNQETHGAQDTDGYNPCLWTHQYEKPYAVSVPDAEAGSSGAFGANTRVQNTQRSDQHQGPPQRTGSPTGPDTTAFQTAPTEQTPTDVTWNLGPGMVSTAPPTGMPMPFSGHPVPQASSFNPQLDNCNVPQYPQQLPAADPDPFKHTANGAPQPRLDESKDYTLQTEPPRHTGGASQATRDMPGPRPMPSSTQTGTGTYESRPTYSTGQFDEEEAEFEAAGSIFETLEVVGLVPENAQMDEAVSKIRRYQTRHRPDPTSYQANNRDTAAQTQHFASELLGLHDYLFPSDKLEEDEKQRLNRNITDLLQSSHAFVPTTKRSLEGSLWGTGWRDTELQVFDDLKKAAQQQAVREGRPIGLTSMMRESPLVQQYNEKMSALDEATSAIEELRKQALGGPSDDCRPRSEADHFEDNLINSLQGLKERIGQELEEIFSGRTFVQDRLDHLVEQRTAALAKGQLETARVLGDAINPIASLLTGTDFPSDAYSIKNLDKIVELSNINLGQWHADLASLAAYRAQRQRISEQLHRATKDALDPFEQKLSELRRMRIEETANSGRVLANMDPKIARTIDLLASLGVHNLQDPSQIMQRLAPLVDSAMSQIEGDRTGFYSGYADYVYHHSGSCQNKWSNNDDAGYRGYEPQPYSQPQGPPVSTHGANPTDNQHQGSSQDSTDDSEGERGGDHLDGNGWPSTGGPPTRAPAPSVREEQTVNGAAANVGPGLDEVQSGATANNAFVFRPQN